ncbi:OprO/OprP family phosphate-selective porin [Pinirhizobacter sp.]|jgi:phosphate-selective porin OprO/OprP|uniref:OprO/OprP family phosphate-selective porin n=1 Tax=Pinirhizobacter sp. TaxID=2950432 RepID=UPI002F3E8FD8
MYQSSIKVQLPRVVLGLAIALGLATPAFSQSAPAANSGNLMLLDTLFKNGVITKVQYDALVAQEQQRQAAAVATVQAAPQASASDTTAAPAQKSGINPFKSKDENFTMKIGGRIQADYGFGDSDKTKIGNAQEMRRTRFDLSGTIYKDWSYMVSYDFSASPDEIKNAYLTYTGFKDTELTVGYFKEFFSLEYQTTNKALEFNERSMLNDSIDPPKRFGLGYMRHSSFGEHSEYTIGVGLFGSGYPRDTDKNDDAGVGGAARATLVPIHTDDRLFHVGINAEYRHPGHTEEVDFATKPSAHFASSLIDTDDILDVTKEQKLGGEVAGVYGPLAMQAQYDTMKIKRSVGPDLSFNGWYAQASYFLTDDSRAKAYENGSYGTIKPKGEYGAWQVGLRYDTQNLISHDIIGGKETNATAALNWYVNKYLRFSIDYTKVTKLDRPGNINDNNKPTIVVGRMWIGF